MGLKLALKAFFRALKDKDWALLFLNDSFDSKSNGSLTHLRFLSLLQESSRFVDFIQEDISDCSDAELGIAVRKIHEQCGNVFEKFIKIRPIMDLDEGEKIKIEEGYDKSKIKLIGNIKGKKPPFRGILRHKGWRAEKKEFPIVMNLPLKGDVICFAEVEL